MKKGVMYILCTSMYILIHAYKQAYVCVHVYMYVRVYASLSHSGMYHVCTC